MNEATMTEVPQERDATLADATTLDAAIPAGALAEPKLPIYLGH